MTRYEVVKNMAVEDMARWLNENNFCTSDFERCYDGKNYTECEKCVEQYLTEEVDEK